MQETRWAAERPPVSTSRRSSSGEPESAADRRDLRILLLLAAAISIAAFAWYYSHGQLLLWGDAVAHMNIARRVFDSRDPGPLQLGTVWLPLPHLLMMPFVVSNWMWRTGVGGAIPSMIAFVVTALGIFRLVRASLGRNSPGRVAAWLAAAIFLLNPNVLYMQSVAMGEALCVAFTIWATVALLEFVRLAGAGEQRDAAGAARWLTACAILLAAGMYTRYDGWFTAGVYSLAVVTVLARRRHGLGAAALRYVLLLAAAAGLWFAYNYALSGSALAFFNGPYSARAIEQRTSAGFIHPGDHNLRVAAIYFTKSVKLTIADGAWQNPFWFVALAGIPLLFVMARRSWALLLLWLPLPFYALSVAYGSIPIFLPVWWPFTYYNVRYGIEVVPAIAVFTAVTACAVAQALGRRQVWAWGGAAVLVAGSYASAWRNQPICLREALANSRDRMAIERGVARVLRQVPPNATILMFTGAHGGALQDAGIPLRRTINETIRGEWPRALADPAREADYVIGFDGDPVAQAVAKDRGELELLATIPVKGQATARVYRSTIRR